MTLPTCDSTEDGPCGDTVIAGTSRCAQHWVSPPPPPEPRAYNFDGYHGVYKGPYSYSFDPEEAA
jgi:hypothetical protein